MRRCRADQEQAPQFASTARNSSTPTPSILRQRAIAHELRGEIELTIESSQKALELLEQRSGRNVAADELIREQIWGTRTPPS